MTDRDLSPGEIARLNREKYDEPGRELHATRPVDPEGAGARGDEDNPDAGTRSHGLSDPDGGKVGSDERNKLARTHKSPLHRFQG